MVDEIKMLIINQLKSTFPGKKVYDEDVQQGLITPAFILRLLQNHQERKLGNQMEREYSFVITFFPLNEREYHSECDAVNEAFNSEFRYIANRFHVFNIDGEKIDRTLVLTFSVKVRLIDVEHGVSFQTLEVL